MATPNKQTAEKPETPDVGPTAGNQTEIKPGLEELAEEAAAIFARTLRYAHLGAGGAVAVAEVLAEARALCPPEDWRAWLARTELPGPTIQALLEIDRTGLDARAVVALGGVALASAWAGCARLPDEGEALAVIAVAPKPEGRDATAFVWRVPEGLCAALADVTDPNARSLVTRRPMTSERELWATVWHLLGRRFDAIAFQLLEEDGPAIVAGLEEHRQEVIKAATPTVH